jgi:hypothetical protein
LEQLRIWQVFLPDCVRRQNRSPRRRCLTWTIILRDVSLD